MQLEELVGLGVTIALTDVFSEAAERLKDKMSEVAQEMGHSAEYVNHAIEQMEGGLAMMGAGAALLKPIIGLAERSAEAAEQNERLKISYESLSDEGGALFESVMKLGDELKVFPDQELLRAGRALETMEVSADKIPQYLRASGYAAAVMGTSVEGAAQRFKNIERMLQLTGPNGAPFLNPRMFARQMADLGVTIPELLAQGVRMNRQRFLSSADEIMDATMAVIQKRMGHGFEEYVNSGAGIDAQMKRLGEKFLKSAGVDILPVIDEIKRSFLEIFQALDPEGLGKGFGEGVKEVFALLAPIGRLLREIALSAANFIAEHPGILKLATAFTALAGLALIGFGAMVTLGGAIKMIPVLLKYASTGIEGLASAWKFFRMAAPEVMLLAGAVALLYAAWEGNFGGLRDTVTGWWETIKTVVEAIVALFTGDEDGQLGSMPKELYDKLVANGWEPTVRVIFLMGARIIEFFKGVWEGFKSGIESAAQLFGRVITVVRVVLNIFGALWDSVFGGVHAVDAMNGHWQASYDLMGALGKVVGWLAAGFVAYKAVMLAVQIGTTAWTAVQWALNGALWANPVGLLVLAFAALAAGIVATIAKMEDFKDTWIAFINSPEIRSLAQKLHLSWAIGGDKSDDEALVARMNALARIHQRSEQLKAEYGDDGVLSAVKKQLNIPGQNAAIPGMPEGYNPAAELAAAQAAQNGGGQGPGDAPAPGGEMRMVAELHLDGEKIHESVFKVEERKLQRSGKF